MSGNRGVVYLGSGKVEVQKIDYPKMQDPRGRKIEHGVILRTPLGECGDEQRPAQTHESSFDREDQQADEHAHTGDAAVRHEHLPVTTQGVVEQALHAAMGSSEITSGTLCDPGGAAILETKVICKSAAPARAASSAL